MSSMRADLVLGARGVAVNAVAPQCVTGNPFGQFDDSDGVRCAGVRSSCVRSNKGAREGVGLVDAVAPPEGKAHVSYRASWLMREGCSWPPTRKSNRPEMGQKICNSSPDFRASRAEPCWQQGGGLRHKVQTAQARTGLSRALGATGLCVLVAACVLHLDLAADL